MRNDKVYLKIHQIIKTKEQSKESESYLKMIDYCLSLMKDEYHLILQNSYFKPSYQFWWTDYYCKSSYYRKRLIAVTSFVSLFEMIYENFNNNSNFIFNA